MGVFFTPRRVFKDSALPAFRLFTPRLAERGSTRPARGAGVCSPSSSSIPAGFPQEPRTHLPLWPAVARVAGSLIGGRWGRVSRWCVGGAGDGSGRPGGRSAAGETPRPCSSATKSKRGLMPGPQGPLLSLSPLPVPEPCADASSCSQPLPVPWLWDSACHPFWFSVLSARGVDYGQHRWSQGLRHSLHLLGHVRWAMQG